MQQGSGVTIPQNVPIAYAADTTTMVIQGGTSDAQSSPRVEEAHSTTNMQTVRLSVVHPQETDAAVEGDKRAIYRHPLFPLMALLFEKCEQASQTSECPSAESFDFDIQTFVQHQERDGNPFFSDDPELDNLMVKAIQVLRIHLLELEKVNELCKDFCTRYTTCLKGKLHSENLLKTSDFPGLEGDSDGSYPSPGAGLLGGMLTQSGTQTTPAVASVNQGQIVSGGTVYQMVQTPQGIVAQPIQQIQSSPPSASSVIHGSTPLSQIGVSSPPQATVPSAPVAPNSALLSPSGNSSDEDDIGGKKKNKRGVLPKQATQVMKSWLFQHIVHPYPTEDEKRQMAQQTNLTLLQVNNWFINARRRILQPMLDAGNPDLSKTKKSKPPQNRPVQRFWPENLANLQTQLQKIPVCETDVNCDSREEDSNQGSQETAISHEEDGMFGSPIIENPTHSGSSIPDMLSQVQQGVAMVTRQMAPLVQNGEDSDNAQLSDSSVAD